MRPINGPHDPWFHPRRVTGGSLAKEREARDMYLRQALDALKRARHHATEALLLSNEDDDIELSAQLERTIQELL